MKNLRQITYGKVPPTIPFKEALNVWVKNQNLTNVDYDVPFVILEVVLAEIKFIPARYINRYKPIQFVTFKNSGWN